MSVPAARSRPQLLQALQSAWRFDVLVIGGGATGLGIALDASLRGFKVLLLEAQDFAKGSSSRATKLLHGGVRYLTQGHWALVHQALHERTVIRANAAHLVSPLPFVIPTFRWHEKPLYGLGLMAYNGLSGSHRLGPTQWLSAAQTRSALPGLNPALGPLALQGGVLYWDAQFDDARLALALARTAARHGALLLNYFRVQGLLYNPKRGSGQERVVGVLAQDLETGHGHRVEASCVINATGVWADEWRRQDQQHLQQMQDPTNEALIEPSQGTHLVVANTLTDGRHALLVPRTQDGRVLFALPWLGHTLIGTTDVARPELQATGMPQEPQPLRQELDFLMAEAQPYLRAKLLPSQIKSMWAGLRPLVHPSQAARRPTAHISREHHIERSASGLMTVTGGKWTTYRLMAEETIDQAIDNGLLPRLKNTAGTAHCTLVGAPEDGVGGRAISASAGLHLYGTEAEHVLALPGAKNEWHTGLSEAMLRFAVRYEYARTVEDLLARRSRLLFLDARRAAELAPAAARVLLEELSVLEPGTSASTLQARVRQQLQNFQTLALQYQGLKQD